MRGEEVIVSQEHARTHTLADTRRYPFLSPLPPDVRRGSLSLRRGGGAYPLTRTTLTPLATLIRQLRRIAHLPHHHCSGHVPPRVHDEICAVLARAADADAALHSGADELR